MGKIRIIGGIHRSRQLPVLDITGLRPTLDRVKETLFNWLGQDLTGKNCLDLFAGSGSLGFEALSRNAHEVMMIEKDGKIVAQLKKNIQLLNVTNCNLYHQDALNFIVTTNHKFDVIFLDPPYAGNLLAMTLPAAIKSLTPNGVCYIEYLNPPELNDYQILKEGKAGQVKYALLTHKKM